MPLRPCATRIKNNWITYIWEKKELSRDLVKEKNMQVISTARKKCRIIESISLALMDSIRMNHVTKGLYSSNRPTAYN